MCLTDNGLWKRLACFPLIYNSMNSISTCFNITHALQNIISYSASGSSWFIISNLCLLLELQLDNIICKYNKIKIKLFGFQVANKSETKISPENLQRTEFISTENMSTANGQQQPPQRNIEDFTTHVFGGKTFMWIIYVRIFMRLIWSQQGVF